jgi:hypothetical protein
LSAALPEMLDAEAMIVFELDAEDMIKIVMFDVFVWETFQFFWINTQTVK